MQMVATSKMRKSQDQALSARSYSHTLSEILGELAGKIHLADHPLLTQRPIRHATILFITPDKGLCGALNANLFRSIAHDEQVDSLRSSATLAFITVGKKGQRYLAKRRENLTLDFASMVSVDFAFAQTIAKILVDAFTKETTDAVFGVYAHFESTLKQSIQTMQILPIERFFLPDGQVRTKDLMSSRALSDYLIEPDPDWVLESILPHYVEFAIYQILLEATASEHSARMIAMKNATDNAIELAEELQFTFNNIRQDAITREILDLVASGASLA